VLGTGDDTTFNSTPTLSRQTPHPQNFQLSTISYLAAAVSATAGLLNYCYFLESIYFSRNV